MSGNPENEETRVIQIMDELNVAVHNRDIDVVRLFSRDERTLLVGAEAGERAYGREQVRALFGRIFDRPVRLAFRWEQRTVNVVGDVAWVFADGYLQSSSAAGEHEHPYCMTGVLIKEDGEWRWILYHGSEPAG